LRVQDRRKHALKPHGDPVLTVLVLWVLWLMCWVLWWVLRVLQILHLMVALENTPMPQDLLMLQPPSLNTAYDCVMKNHRKIKIYIF